MSELFTNFTRETLRSSLWELKTRLAAAGELGAAKEREEGMLRSELAFAEKASSLVPLFHFAPRYLSKGNGWISATRVVSTLGQEHITSSKPVITGELSSTSLPGVLTSVLPVCEPWQVSFLTLLQSERKRYAK